MESQEHLDEGFQFQRRYRRIKVQPKPKLLFTSLLRSQSVDDPFRGGNMQRSASVFSYFSKNADEIREVVRSVGNRMRSVKRRTRKKKTSMEAYSTDDSTVVQSAKVKTFCFVF